MRVMGSQVNRRTASGLRRAGNREIRSPLTTRRSLVVLVSLLLLACPKPDPLTKEKAEAILRSMLFTHEPIYAEVPQKVWWNAHFPKDDFDEKSLRTFENLRKAGLITVSGGPTPDGGAAYVAKVTPQGFHVLGTAPSMRGAVYRGLICYKKYDGIRDFQRHPTEPTTGRAQLVWHYDDPTPLYPMFETRINKPLKHPFASLVSFYWKDGQYKFEVTVKKTDVTLQRDMRRTPPLAAMMASVASRGKNPVSTTPA
jgi:hypothetical protein